MINIYLPFSTIEDIHNSIIYQQFFDKNQQLSKFKEDLIVKGLYGSFPGAIWNGGRAPSKEIPYSKEKIKEQIEFLNQNNIECRMTFTNCLIEEEHLNDPYCNMILDLMDNGAENKIIINSPILENYILKEHPNLGLVSSITKGNDYNTFVQNIIKPQYDLVVCYPKKNVLEYIEKNLSPKDASTKIEVMMNSGCSHCPKFDWHYKLESYNNLYQAEKSMPCYRSSADFDSLSEKINTEEQLIYDLDLLDKLNIKHFKFQGRGSSAIRIGKDVINNIFNIFDKEIILDLERKLTGV